MTLLLTAAAAQAQSAYAHRDANGQWVFTDRPDGTNGTTRASIALEHEPAAMQLSLTRVDHDDVAQLVASSNCLCVATMGVTIEQSELEGIPAGAKYLVRLEPGEHDKVVREGRHGGHSALRFSWRVALGSPDAVHQPPRPYRAPFAVGSTYTVTQAYPVRITHVTPDTEYAIDFALPDGTPVYAAREGVAINVQHDSFRGGALPAMLDQANVVEILHDDGTIAVYAHLQWDSIRVRIGQRVRLGEYIANSGNTGFTTGPHLHFAVWRNVAGKDVSIPVQFAGLGGAPVSAATSTPLTAY
ncbi:MAG: M23 family metallopeptidase [Candidatus Dormibacteraeota bacterium]|nr:M23 family metallopeptidase [Candidatus Dormibacteraeota bacterium]